MKKIVWFALIGLILGACGGNDKGPKMVVNGNVKGLKKGTLYLQTVPDSVLVTVDSLEIAGDGQFSFEVPLESPEIYYLYLDKVDNNDINDRITFFAEPGTITINTAWNTFDVDANIQGSKSQEKLEEYRQVMSRFNKNSLSIGNAMNQAQQAGDTTALDSLNNLVTKNVQRGYVYALNFALNNKDSYIAPYIALYEVPDANKKYLDSIYNSLSPEVAQSKYGQQLGEYLSASKEN